MAGCGSYAVGQPSSLVFLCDVTAVVTKQQMNVNSWLATK